MARYQRSNSLISIIPTPHIIYRHFRDSLRARVMAFLTLTTTVFAIVFTVGLLLHGNTKAKQGDYIEWTVQKQDGVGPFYLAAMFSLTASGCMHSANVPGTCIQRGRVTAPGRDFVVDYRLREV